MITQTHQHLINNNGTASIVPTRCQAAPLAVSKHALLTSVLLAKRMLSV